MKINFSKLQGSGNDFIVIDNMDLKIDSDKFREIVPKITRRALSIGADGVIIIEPSDKADFKWRFFNSDGSEAEMCGNGGRCAARFAYEKGIAGSSMKFLTLAGIINAEVKGRRVKIQLTQPKDWVINAKLEDLNIHYHFVNTGVPHVVIFVENLNEIDVEGIGRKIRYHKIFQPKGTNVNFVELRDKQLLIRTYERGVEAETLACGTGATASAIIAMKLGLIKDKSVDVVTKSGEILKIYYEEATNTPFLEGDTRWIYDGTMREEAYI